MTSGVLTGILLRKILTHEKRAKNRVIRKDGNGVRAAIMLQGKN